jgi:hypothetical protein
MTLKLGRGEEGFERLAAGGLGAEPFAVAVGFLALDLLVAVGVGVWALLLAPLVLESLVGLGGLTGLSRWAGSGVKMADAPRRWSESTRPRSLSREPALAKADPPKVGSG